jgi:Flp pilus assembly protein TadB
LVACIIRCRCSSNRNENVGKIKATDPPCRIVRAAVVVVVVVAVIVVAIVVAIVVVVVVVVVDVVIVIVILAVAVTVIILVVVVSRAIRSIDIARLSAARESREPTMSDYRKHTRKGRSRSPSGRLSRDRITVGRIHLLCLRWRSAM